MYHPKDISGAISLSLRKAYYHMWRDCFGRKIYVGDLIYYPVNKGSSGGQQARWGKVLHKYEKHPHNVVEFYKSTPHLLVKAVQNTKNVILMCGPNNLIVNLSAPPITNVEELPNK